MLGASGRGEGGRGRPEAVTQERVTVTRRSVLGLLLIATGWADSVVTFADGGSPSLSLAFGPPDGFRDLRVRVNGEDFIITPEEIAQALRAP